MGIRVWGSGVQVAHNKIKQVVSRCRVPVAPTFGALNPKPRGLGCRIWGLGLGGWWGAAMRVWEYRLRVNSLGIGDWGLRDCGVR